MIVSWAGFEQSGSTLTVPGSTAFNVTDANAGEHAAFGYALQATQQAVSKTFTNSAVPVTPAAGIVALKPAPGTTGTGTTLLQLARDATTGLVQSATDARGKVTSFGYDASGNLTSVTSPLGRRTTIAYDSSGRATSTVDGRGNETGANPDDYRTSFTYNAADQLLTSTDPLGHTTTLAYDLAGNLASVTDAKSHVTSYGYDAANELTTVTAPGAVVTGYSYDPVGNILTRTDANNHVTSYAYDKDNRLTSVLSPTQQQWTYEHDPNGNVTKVVDAIGNSTADTADGTTTYGYDAVNRLTSIGYTDATPGVQYAYDGDGNRTSMTDGSGTVSYAYDDVNNLATVSRGSDTFSYAYDAAGNVVQRTYPGAPLATYAYNDDGDIASVTSEGATTAYTYDAAGGLTRTDLPSGNGYTELRQYDRAGRLTRVSNEKGVTILSRFDYAYDAVGNPTSVTTPTGVTTYGYDSRDRLVDVCFQASCPGSGDPFIRYGYDGVGNRLSEARPTGTTNSSYNAADQLVSSTGPGGTTYSYDADGNETQAGSKSYAYDLAGRMTSANDGTTTTAYSYDGDGNRLLASTGALDSQKTKYLWDTNAGLPQLALERDGAGTTLRSYLYGNNRIALRSGGQLFYYHSDGIGSVVNMTSATGVAEWTYSYEPFGTARTAVKNDPAAPVNEMRFEGELLDATGLYDLRARQYDSGVGRFTATDPLARPMGTPYASSYVYGEDRPTALVDPSGMGAVDGPDCAGIISGGCLNDWFGPWFIQDQIGWRNNCLRSTRCLLGVELNIAIMIVPEGRTEEVAARAGEGLLGRIGARLGDDTGSLNPAARRNLPPRGRPNSTDVIDRGGGRGQIREYGPNGEAAKDFDFGHDHGSGDPHVHDWINGVRQPGRPIRPGE
jgi:RHS repeat-associated protein